MLDKLAQGNSALCDIMVNKATLILGLLNAFQFMYKNCFYFVWLYIFKPQEECYLIADKKVITIQSFKLRETKASTHLVEMGFEVLQYVEKNITTTTEKTTTENIRSIFRALQIKFANVISSYCTIEHIPRTPHSNYENLVSSSLQVVTGTQFSYFKINLSSPLKIKPFLHY